MVACIPSCSRSPGRSVAIAIILAVICKNSVAQAAHERPWLASKTQAQIVQSIPLPGNALWHQALPLSDGSVILLREQSVDENGPFLLRLGPGATAATPLQPDWSGAADGARTSDNFLPTAMTNDEDGGLWLINQGRKDLRPRLIKLDPVSGKILAQHVLPTGSFTETSRFTSLAMRDQTAYLADEGSQALATVDLRRDAGARFFAGYPTSRGHKPLSINHKVIYGEDGRPLTRDIAHLALELNGKWLYEQAPTGPLYRLSTALLTDPTVTPMELMESVTEWRDTPTVGGITIDSQATLYFTDLTDGRILGFDAGRHPRILLSSPLLTEAGIPGWRKSKIQRAEPGQLYVPAGHRLLRIALP